MIDRLLRWALTVGMLAMLFIAVVRSTQGRYDEATYAAIMVIVAYLFLRD